MMDKIKTVITIEVLEEINSENENKVYLALGVGESSELIVEDHKKYISEQLGVKPEQISVDYSLVKGEAE